MASYLLMVFAILSATLPLCYGEKKVIVSLSGKNNATACLSGVGECSNLTMALEGITSDTTVIIESGTYTLRRSAHHVFSQVRNVVISGQASTREVIVKCDDAGAGLTFLQATTVNISNVSFYGCGYEQMSNSRVSKDSKFAKYKVALFFQLCKNVILSKVNVSYSKGIAVQFFATIGNNEISWSNFMNNTGGQTVGGGVYIEFPYCLPGNQTCEETSNVPKESTSGGTFRILHSNFYYNDAHPPKNESRVFMVPHLADHVSFGRGGGLSVFFKGNTNLSKLNVSKCHFIHNKAVYGGGAFVEFQDNSHNNMVLFDLCSFDSNLARQQGGGLRLSFASSISNLGPKVSDMHQNCISIVINAFINNEAHASGGGMFFGATRENASTPTNNLTIAWGNWTDNIAPVGSAISMIGWHEVTRDGAIIAPVLEECIFNSNRPPSSTHDEQSVGKGTIYLDSIPIQFAGSAKFINNKHTALAGANTGIYFKSSSSYSFVNNTARQGGAIALLGNAFFIINQQTRLDFINNTAYYLGGAIFATSLTGQDSISSGNCFIRYYDLMTDPYQWNAQFTFIGNTAMGRPNAIYTSSPQPCLWGRAFGPPHDDESDISAVFCWNNASLSEKKWDYGDKKCADEIMSAPSKFGLNNMPTVEIQLNNVVPGKWKSFNLTTLDDFGNDVSNYTVFAAQSLSPNVILSDHSHYLAYHSILLYQLNTNVNSGTVALQTVNMPNPILATLHITFMECPPGFKLKQGQCMCVAKDYNYRLECDTSITSAHSDIERGYWIGYYPFNDNKTVVMAVCRFCFYQNNTISVESFTDVQHKLCHEVNRNGTLCSQCINDYCFAVNSESYECIKYDTNIPLPALILFFVLYKFLFPLIFLWFVYRFGIEIASGKYNAPVFFAQMVTTVVPIDLDGALWYPPALKKIYFILYDVLNLELRLPEFGRFCIHPKMSVTFVIALNYCVALLPLVLVIAMAIVYKLHDMRYKVWCCNFEDGYNQGSKSGCKKIFYYINRVLFSRNRNFLVSGVAAFFVLSYMKIAVTTGMLITPNKLINGDGYVLYMDGSKKYPDDVIQYLALALIFCVYLFVVPFSLLLLRYGKQAEGFLNYLLKGLQANFRSLPSADKGRQNSVHRQGKSCYTCSKRCEANFNTDTELCSAVFESCYGSNYFCSCSVHDFRWVSGAYFVLRILMVVTYVLPTDMLQLLSHMLICCAAAAFFIIFQPYGYNHTEKDEQERESLHLQQELSDTAQLSPPVHLKCSPSKKYNRLDAAVFLALAMVIAICIYRLYLTNIDGTSSIPILALQSVLLFLPAAWFGYHILLDLKKRWSSFKNWVTDVRQKRRQGGILYDPLPINDDQEEDNNE